MLERSTCGFVLSDQLTETHVIHVASVEAMPPFPSDSLSRLKPMQDMCVCASSKNGLNRGLCLNVISTAAIVGDCHGRSNSETLKTHLMNHVKTLRGSAQNLGGNLANPRQK
jgi:hypothetical protein